ncbi:MULTISPECIES: adhesin [Stenotrophomonas]|uniref:Adhesin n=1 Tax=Stenotrophomonas lactitubi TaxID=2045214 RepID=A0AAW4GDE3_9GAMM|nr:MULTISPECIES: adhesin [unclassified Stenotrophomonas]MBM9912877.1 adhesin [Stenotrophomonas lactitubi]MBM9922570.1 adhesin [Stenotrophomonas lactitubi]MBM9937595.1 adhesin [Stenotrophomonas lactitubi]
MTKHLVLCLAIGLTACAAQEPRADSCPTVVITYAGIARVDGMTYGRFQINPHGSRPLQLLLASADRRLYARAATAEVRRIGEQAWRSFNVILEEVAPPAARLSIAPGEAMTVLFDGDGAFMPGAISAGEEFSIIVRDVQGCAHRSVPFRPGVNGAAAGDREAE